MTAAAVIMLAVKTSLAMTVLTVSLNARPSDATYLVRRPWLLLRSFLAMNVVMPFVALWFSMVFALSPAVKLALITLAVSPVPPFLPGKAIKSGGDSAYTVSLLTTMAMLSIVVIPLTMAFFGSLFGLPLSIRPTAIANIVANGILLPVALGIATRWAAPVLADKLVKPVRIIATVVLIGGLIPILKQAWPAVSAVVDDGTVFAIVGITVLGLAVGHTFGGPARDDRPVLALATACRHPAVAITIATTMFPNEQLVGAAVLADLLIAGVVTLPYVRMSRRGMSATEPQPRRVTDAANAPTPSHHRA
jgi:BASS family bile acid:Na+ symporter